MKAVILVVGIVLAGALVILVAVVPAVSDARLEGIAIGEEAGKVMWRVGAFYEVHGKLPARTGELRLPGTATRQYRVDDSGSGRWIELAYSVLGGEVTIRHQTGAATFAPVLEQGKVARWHLKDSTYSAAVRGPIEFGAMSAVRCLGEPAAKQLAECARFQSAAHAIR